MGGRLILFNKPFNVLCQFTAEGTAKRTLADFVDVPGVYPAGRLDFDSEGLLLLTDTGWLQHRIANPAAKMPKTYWAQVEGEPAAEAIAKLAAGLMLNDGPALPAQALRIDEPAGLWPRVPPIRQRQSIPTAWLAITLREGRNRQVRRMTATIGHPTLRLIRARIGDWTLDDLSPGEWREAPLPRK